MAPKVKKVPKKKPRARPPSYDSRALLDSHGAMAARMFYDPCGANLGETVYPGDRGYVSRFVQNISVGLSGGQTVTASIIKPGNNVASFTAGLIGTDNTTVGFGTASMPGAGFQNTTANKFRCAGFCVTARAISAPNTATGTIHFGVVPASAVTNGTITQFNTLISYCTESVAASNTLMAPLDIKWSPGSFDDRYATTANAADDDSDRNIIIICTTGFPAATGLQLRLTAIYEWTPAISLGIVTDATSVKNSVCDKECVLKVLKSKDPDWWWSLGRKAVKIAGGIAAGAWTGGPVGALGAAVRFMG